MTARSVPGDVRRDKILARKSITLIDELLACWPLIDDAPDVYLIELAQEIVKSPETAKLTATETKIVRQLRQLLPDSEWSRLPELLRERWQGALQELESDRLRAESQRADDARANALAAQVEQARVDAERDRALTQRELDARKRSLVDRLEGLFESDFLSADEGFAEDTDASLITADEYDGLKASFVARWAKRLGEQLDQDQAGAVASTSGDIQVVARAGSGKTRTLVTRAIFLQKHCGVSPRELLLLAFNRNAAEEMKKRLAAVLGDDLPHVMTFHALAYAIVDPEEELIRDDRETDQLLLSRELQRVIDERLRSSEHAELIQGVMLSHFREDWENIVRGKFHLNADDFLEYRRSLAHETLKDRKYVKSFGEKLIANTLFEHGVEYQYERSFRGDGGSYRPDFTIPLGSRGGVVIEYFGLGGDADYDKDSRWKREYWKRHPEWTFLEYSPRDLATGNPVAFATVLLRDLGKAGIAHERRTEDEIWRLVEGRAVDSFSRAMAEFIGRCRQGNLDPDDLRSKVSAHASSSTAERLFLEVGVSIYEGYLERLEREGLEDFNGLIWRATERIGDGHTSFVRDKNRERGDVGVLRYVMVDEFQDFSPAFLGLLDATRQASPSAQFFCVGDDWQAINRFAGADLGIFTGFSDHFRSTSRRLIRTNYRSATSVVGASNALMLGKGEAAHPERSDEGTAMICKLDEFVHSAAEAEQHGNDEITPAVLRLVWAFLGREQDVVLLSRRATTPPGVNFAKNVSGTLDDFLDHVRSFVPEEFRGRVTASTTHSYKGRERSAVVILDAYQRSYPLIHPNWVFLQVFGDDLKVIDEEERRLFYVALTRAKDSLAVITETARPSPYLREIELAHITWNSLPPPPSSHGPTIEIRVHDAYDVRDQLKKLGYTWVDGGKYWRTAARADGFSFESLLEQPWARDSWPIEVFDESGKLVHTKKR